MLKRSPNLLHPLPYSCAKPGECFQCQKLSEELPQWPCKAQGRISTPLGEQSFAKRGGKPSPAAQVSLLEQPSMQRCHTDHLEIAHCLKFSRKDTMEDGSGANYSVSSSFIKLSNTNHNLSAAAVSG